MQWEYCWVSSYYNDNGTFVLCTADGAKFCGLTDAKNEKHCGRCCGNYCTARYRWMGNGQLWKHDRCWTQRLFQTSYK